MVDPRERLLQEAAALQELDTRRSMIPIAGFTPHPGQQLWLDSKAPIVLGSAGNRWGKTHVLVAYLISCIYGYFPWLIDGLKLQLDENGKPDLPPRSMIPSGAWIRRLDGLPVAVPGKWIMVTGLPLERGIGEIIQSKWGELWPRQVEKKVYLGPLGTWRKLVAPNESEVYFGSATQNDLALEGFAADGGFIDEPVPARVFTAMRRGLVDRHGQLRMTLTPLGDAATAWLAADLMGGSRTDVEVIRGSGLANPHIDRQRLLDFLNDPSMSEAERRARKDGEIAALGWRIVSTFGDHAIVPSTAIEYDVPRMCVLDPHHAKPPAIIWVACYGDDDLVVYREWPEADFEKAGVPAMSLDKIAGVIKAAEGKEQVRWRVCDPNLGPAKAKRFGEQYRSFVDEMHDYDLWFAHNVDDDIDRGIQALRDAFIVDPVARRPRMRVMRHCVNTIAALNYWSYETKDGAVTKPSEKYKDFVDCIRYALMYRRPQFSAEGGSNYLTESWGEDE